MLINDQWRCQDTQWGLVAALKVEDRVYISLAAWRFVRSSRSSTSHSCRPALILVRPQECTEHHPSLQSHCKLIHITILQSCILVPDPPLSRAPLSQPCHCLLLFRDLKPPRHHRLIACLHAPPRRRPASPISVLQILSQTSNSASSPDAPPRPSLPSSGWL